jgi:ABC-type branched-subunit amino acid transport system ATPase component
MRIQAAVSATSDRCVVLVKGRVVFKGSGAALREQPEVLSQYPGV